MSILAELKSRFRRALVDLPGVAPDGDVNELLELIRRSTDPKFGDYQANLAMPLGKRLGRPPREVAAEVLQRLQVDDLCEQPEIAGPGFINLRLKDTWLVDRLTAAAADERLGIAELPAADARTYVIDYSAPNVAKPMHVGHIRSTVIGDALYRILRFLGHRTISDNHLGDWGTQFGMIIYGYKHFLDERAYERDPVAELARLYRNVRALMDYYQLKEDLPKDEELLKLEERRLQEMEQSLGEKPSKKARNAVANQATTVTRRRTKLGLDKLLFRKMAQAGGVTPDVSQEIPDHPDIREQVLAETAKLHEGDPENVRLWQEFMPACRQEIDRIYRRLGVRFDYTLGESFYNDRLESVVDELFRRGIARESEGAVCVFLEGYETPMLVRKQDGAFLYATTDLATIRYRMEQFQPDAILYVVDHRQALHFEHLFATARRMGYRQVELTHVSFGTVLGEDPQGRRAPFKTRAGDTVGLEGLLDEAVRRAAEIVAANDDAKPDGPELSADRRRQIAEIVGIGALKYADLSQNRTSDYVFSYDKMLAMNGNTATYMQYAYARVRSIFAKGGVDVESLRASGAPILLDSAAERALGLKLLQVGEALDLAVLDYRPNQLTGYLFELADCYSTFYECCPVLKAETDPLRQSRLLLCDLTARTIRKGLELLGIEVVEKM
jgi:arginyl-tRNA synthetase